MKKISAYLQVSFRLSIKKHTPYRGTSEMLSQGTRMGPLCASGKKPPHFQPEPFHTHLHWAPTAPALWPPPIPTHTKRGYWQIIFSETSQTMLDDTKFNPPWTIQNLTSGRINSTPNACDKDEQSSRSSQEKGFASFPLRSIPTVVGLSFRQAWCWLASLLFCQNPHGPTVL